MRYTSDKKKLIDANPFSNKDAQKIMNGLLTNTAISVIEIIPDKKLQDALTQAFEEAAD